MKIYTLQRKQQTPWIIYLLPLIFAGVLVIVIGIGVPLLNLIGVTL